jgi:Fe2+ or Zn2+ uptake regulation protein
MEKGELLGSLIDAKKAAVLRVLLNSGDELCLKEVTEKSKVPVTSTFRILQELVDLGIIDKREWKNSKTYPCRNGERVDFLREIFHEQKDAVQEFVNDIKDFHGIQRIILHGKRDKKANLILIGEGINNRRVAEVQEEINKRGFELGSTILTSEQYEQMSKMGLFSGEKKVLR